MSKFYLNLLKLFQPTTSSAGAKAGESSAFIPMIIRVVIPLIFRNFFANGLKEMQIKCSKSLTKTFINVKGQRNQLMSSLREDAIATNKAPSFSSARFLTILGLLYL
jgi:hypothetical protein